MSHCVGYNDYHCSVSQRQILKDLNSFAFDPEEEDEDDRYWLWRFMIDQNEQGKGYGQAALAEIIKYFRDNGADRLYLSTEPENECGLHIYHKAGFRETGVIDDGEAILMMML